MEALQKECLEEINNDHYHPYKNINRHVIEQLKGGNLPDKIDSITWENRFDNVKWDDSYVFFCLGVYILGDGIVGLFNVYLIC